MGELKKEIMSKAIPSMKSFTGDNLYMKKFIDRLGDDLFNMKTDNFHTDDYKDSLKNMDDALKSSCSVSDSKGHRLDKAVDALSPKDIVAKFEKQPIFSAVLSKISTQE